MKCNRNLKSEKKLKESLLEDSSQLRIINLTKIYTLSYFNKIGLKAVDDFCLNLNENEITGIIGQNGAGKSTLLGMLIGCITPTSGNAVLGERNLNETGLGFLGYCPQQNILWENLSGGDHIYIFTRLRGTFYNDDILKSVKLHDVKDLAAGNYSGGMKRRLSLAISSVGNPKIILMDEPTTGLDPITKRQICKIICDMKKNKIVIMTTHSMDEAENLSDRVVIMSKGKLRAEGTPALLKATYSTEYTLQITSDHLEQLSEEIKHEFSNVGIKTNSNNLSLTVVEGSTGISLIINYIENSALVKSWSITQDSLDKILSILS